MAGDFVERARELLRAGQAQEAVRACRLGLLAQPSSVPGRILLAEALFAVGRADDAMAEARLALDHDAGAAAALVIQGRVFLERGDVRSATPILERAEKLGADTTDLLDDARRAAAKPSSTPIGGVIATAGEFADPAETKLYPARRPGTAPARAPSTVEIRSGDVEESLDVAGGEATIQVETHPDNSGDLTLDQAEDLFASSPGRIHQRPTSPAAAPGAVLIPVPESGFSFGLLVYIVLTLCVGAGVGFFLRSLRFDRDLDRLDAQAAGHAAEQTYRGYLLAEAGLRTVVAVRPDDDARGALRRLHAAMRVELGVPMPPDSGERPPHGRDADAASIYLALADGDTTTATTASRALVAAHPDDAEAAYLAGRALVAANEPAAAVAELERSARLQPRPMTLVALAEAHAARGRPDVAIESLDAALALAPGHPAALLMRARLLAAARRLPTAPDPEQALAELMKEADSGPDIPRVSPVQAAWAGLALAEVALARGDKAAAEKALAAAASHRPERDLGFGAALVTAYVWAGRIEDARAEASLWAQRYPGSVEPRLWAAETALVQGVPDMALAELDRAPQPPAVPALVMRARAELALANPGGAARDLDSALAQRPGDRIALLLRAEVDVETGDYAGAVRRLEPVYQKGGNPEIALLFGSAMRRVGDRARATQLVDEAVAGATDPSMKSRALTEKGRILRDAGRLGEAGEAFAGAAALDGAAAPRIESALLALDLGDSLAARTALDKLVASHGHDPDVLLECARIHALRGDRAGAAKLVEGARRRPGASAFRLAREEGRVALIDGRGSEAALVLARAVEVDGADGETRLLLVDALIESAPQGSLAAAQAAVLQMTKDFAGRAEADLARGRLHLAKGEGQEAVSAFLAAVKLRTAEPAPPRLVADAKTWVGRGQDYVGDLDGSMASYAEAVKLDPSNALAHFYRGRIQLERGLIEQAHDSFERAVASNAGIVEAYYHLGETGAKLGKPAARQALLTYLKLAPDGEFVAPARLLLKRVR